EGSKLTCSVPMTIAFATESGGAELVAEELSQAIEGDIEVIDLAESTVDDLDPQRFHILVASTYGDGEIPSDALPFHASVTSGETDHEGMRISVFGLGDRSYDRTYSRGSEILAEALVAAGAQQVGEYGRHDAGGPEPATDTAMDWVVAIVEEANASLVAP